MTDRKIKSDGNIDIEPSTGNITNVESDTTINGDLTVTGDIFGNVTGDLTGNATGDLTGNVTGNVTGDLTGNVTGNVTGDLTGNVNGYTFPASDGTGGDALLTNGLGELYWGASGGGSSSDLIEVDISTWSGGNYDNKNIVVLCDYANDQAMTTITGDYDNCRIVFIQSGTADTNNIITYFHFSGNLKNCEIIASEKLSQSVNVTYGRLSFYNELINCKVIADRIATYSGAHRTIFECSQHQFYTSSTQIIFDNCRFYNSYCVWLQANAGDAIKIYNSFLQTQNLPLSPNYDRNVSFLYSTIYADKLSGSNTYDYAYTVYLTTFKISSVVLTTQNFILESTSSTNEVLNTETGFTKFKSGEYVSLEFSASGRIHVNEAYDNSKDYIRGRACVWLDANTNARVWYATNAPLYGYCGITDIESARARFSDAKWDSDYFSVGYDATSTSASNNYIKVNFDGFVKINYSASNAYTNIPTNIASSDYTYNVTIGRERSSTHTKIDDGISGSSLGVDSGVNISVSVDNNANRLMTNIGRGGSISRSCIVEVQKNDRFYLVKDTNVNGTYSVLQSPMMEIIKL